MHIDMLARRCLDMYACKHVGGEAFKNVRHLGI